MEKKVKKMSARDFVQKGSKETEIEITDCIPILQEDCLTRLMRITNVVIVLEEEIVELHTDSGHQSIRVEEILLGQLRPHCIEFESDLLFRDEPSVTRLLFSSKKEDLIIFWDVLIEVQEMKNEKENEK